MDENEIIRLGALREATRVGITALDRQEFKEFSNVDDLQTYLHELSEKIISATAKHE